MYLYGISIVVWQHCWGGGQCLLCTGVEEEEEEAADGSVEKQVAGDWVWSAQCVGLRRIK